MILDPEKIVSDYTEEEQGEIVAQVRADFLGAEENRNEREEIALEDYELYMRKRRDAAGQAAARGGISKIEVPIVYWNIEHQVPRLGVQPPTFSVRGLTAESVPYAMAKQARLNHFLKRCGWDIPYQMIVRSKLILGDGIAMTPWSDKLHMPRLMHVDWFDMFISSEATVFEEAEAHFHRTFWTPRGLEQLVGQLDEKERLVWHNLDDLPAATRREHVDDTWARRRSLAEQGTGAVAQGTGGQELPFISCWYETGEYVVLGGPEYGTLIRAQMSPYRRRITESGGSSEIEWLRPFVFFRNIPDLTGPYSLSEPRVLGDHQLEMSTLRNIFIDQVHLDVNSPIVHDESIPDEKVARAFATPKGRLAVPWGPAGPLIMRMGPGQPSASMPMVYDQVRNEVQLISGVNDNAAGQPVDGEQTATEVTILSQEANRRMQLKRKMDEIAMAEVGRHFDYRDRQFGGVIHAEMPPGLDPAGALGITPAGQGQLDTLALMAGRGPAAAPPLPTSGLVRLGTGVNGPGLDYEVEIEAGSSLQPEKGEEAQRLNAFLAGASHPAIAPLIDWAEVARTYISSHGFDPERLMVPVPPPGTVPVGPDGQPIPPPGAPPAPPA